MSESQAAPTGAFPVPGLRPPSQRTGAKRRIGDVIVQLGFAERELVEKVVDEGRANGVPLGQSLIDAGIVDSNQLAQALAERNGLDYVDLNSFEVDQGAANLIDANKARRYQTIPVSFLGEQTVLVATADPANVLALDDIAMATGYEIVRAVASPEDIDALIGQISRLGDSVEELGTIRRDGVDVVGERDRRVHHGGGGPADVRLVAAADDRGLLDDDRDVGHGEHRLHGIRADARLRREHHRGGAVDDRVGDVRRPPRASARAG